MTTDQFIAVLGGFAALIGAVAGLWSAVHGYHKEVNGRLDALLNLTASSSYARGIESTKPPVNQPEA